MINLWSSLPRTRLFLVCPTDSLEVLIRKKFMGDAFFCTALGVYFKFDHQLQNDLWDLIKDNGIEEVILVSSVDNVFYRQAFNKRHKYNYPVNKVLSRMEEGQSGQLNCSGAFFSNLYSLVSNHLTDQKERLLSTDHLGSNLTYENIAVKAYAYQPFEEVYYTPHEIQRRGSLLNGVSCN